MVYKGVHTARDVPDSTGKTTIKSLMNIYKNFTPAETFMSDGGRHFNNMEVKEFCNKWGGKHHVVAAYSPWINGLVEGTNKILLYILAHLCAPDIGEDGWKASFQHSSSAQKKYC